MPLQTTAPIPPSAPRREQARPRPVFTYIAFAIVAIGALGVEFATMNNPEVGGGTFLLFAPVMVLGFGIDWIRLERPGALRVAWALTLSAAAIHIVVYGLVHDWLPTLLASAAVATVLVVLRWTVASIPPRVMQGTFIGSQEGRWLFVDQERCLSLASDAHLNLSVGRRYALRAKLERDERQGTGPYRNAQRMHGILIDIANHPRVFVGRSHERAWNYTRGIMSAMTLVAIALILPQLDL